MSYHGARSGAPVDWSDPQQVTAQAKLDVLRNMISHNPMSYSEKEELVRHHLADEKRRAEQEARDKQGKEKKSWDI